MKELKTEIEINAGAEKVWKILTDFPAFASWNSFIPAIQGRAEKGARLRLFVKMPFQKRAMRLKPVVLKAEPARELRWFGKLWGLGFLFAGEHFFRIQKIGDQQVKFIHGERFTGLLLPIVWKVMGEQIRMGYVQFNRDLKRECEL